MDKQDENWVKRLAIMSQERSAKLFIHKGSLHHDTVLSNEFSRYYLLRLLGYDRFKAWDEAKLRSKHHG